MAISRRRVSAAACIGESGGGVNDKPAKRMAIGREIYLASISESSVSGQRLNAAQQWHRRDGERLASEKRKASIDNMAAIGWQWRR